MTKAKLRGAEADPFIQAAHPIPLQVDCDMLIAQRAQLAHDAVAHVRLEGAVHLITAELEPRERRSMLLGARRVIERRVVVPYSAYAKAQNAQHVFRPLDHLQ